MLAPEPFCFPILDSKKLLTTKEIENPLIGMKQSVLLPLFSLSIGDTVIVWVTADVICRRVTGGLEFQNVNSTPRNMRYWAGFSLAEKNLFVQSKPKQLCFVDS